MIKKVNPYILQFEKLVYTNFEDSIYDKFESLLNEFTNSVDRLKFLYESKELFKEHGIKKLAMLSFDTFYFTKTIKKEIFSRDFFFIILEYPLFNNFSDEDLCFVKENYNLDSFQDSNSIISLNKNIVNSKVCNELTKVWNEFIPRHIQLEKSKLKIIKNNHRYNGNATFKLIDNRLDLKNFYEKLKIHNFISENTKFLHFKKVFEDINLTQVSNKIIWNSNETQLLLLFKILFSERIIEKKQHAFLSIINFLFINKNGEPFNKKNWKIIFCNALKEKQVSDKNKLLIEKIISDSFI